MTASPSDRVRQARVDLAAALRWADRLGLSEGVCNHFSLQVPDTPDQFLLNPQGLHWSEIKASDLIIVDPHGNLIEGKHRAEPTAFFIHSRIHQHRPSARCVMHTHMPYATALCCIDGGRLEMCSQNALQFYGRVAYDQQYNGLALDAAEGDRLAEQLGDADVLFLANHGVIVIGEDVAQTFNDLYYLERACIHQVLAQSTQRPLKMIPESVCESTQRQMAETREQSYHFLAAMVRVLSREAPEFLE